mmetsp:Transcript_39384/g.72557  ORF Transcript_39384/g.72557 Transcript_39384/m.72557 type:complete len:409 (+) Transcript_39384:66-1292(+)
MDFSAQGYPPDWPGGPWPGWGQPSPYWAGPGMYDPSFDPRMLEASYLAWQQQCMMMGAQPNFGMQPKRRSAPRQTSSTLAKRQILQSYTPPEWKKKQKAVPVGDSDLKKEKAEAPTAAAAAEQGLHVHRLKTLFAGSKEDQMEAFDLLQGNVWQYTIFSQDSCCIVQDALEAANVETLRRLVQELHGHVPEAAESPNGNHVLQKIIEVSSFAEAVFIAEEILPRLLHVCRNRYGCRIICRLLEQKSWDHKAIALLVDALLKKVCELSRHPFGHYVIQSLLENGNAEQQKCVAQGFFDELHRHATNRTASHVLEKVFFFCGTEERRMLAGELLREDGAVDAEKIDELAQNQSGCRTLKAVVGASVEESLQVLLYIEQNLPRIQENKWGRRMVEEWAKAGKIKMPSAPEV